VGYGELFLAMVAGAGDLHEQYRIHVLDAAYHQELSYLKRILLIFLPAVGDAGLAFLDFFVFTTQAEADSERLRESILSSVGAPTTWCLSLADDCLPIIEEDADRTGGKWPEKLDEDSVWITFAVSLGVLMILYLGGIFLYPYLRGVGPFKRPAAEAEAEAEAAAEAAAEAEKAVAEEAAITKLQAVCRGHLARSHMLPAAEPEPSHDPTNSKRDSDESTAAVSSTSAAYDSRLDSIDEDDILAKAERIRLKRIQRL